jgi:thiamine pyrophosphokinase
MRTVVISSGSRPVPPLPPAGRVIAADGGLQRAITAGVIPDIVIGDFDSVSAETLERYRASGGTVSQYPRDKNATDLELAVDLVEPGTELVIVGGDGDDRFDHFIGELTHLSSRADRFASVTVHYPHALILVVTGGRTVQLTGIAGSIVSLVPMFEVASGVTTSGLRWPLTSEPLLVGTTRGMSNELLTSTAEVSVESGTLLVIQPTPGAIQ